MTRLNRPWGWFSENSDKIYFITKDWNSNCLGVINDRTTNSATTRLNWPQADSMNPPPPPPPPPKTKKLMVIIKSGFRGYMSGVRFRFQVPGVICQVSGVTCHMTLTRTANATNPPSANSPSMHKINLLFLRGNFSPFLSKNRKFWQHFAAITFSSRNLLVINSPWCKKHIKHIKHIQSQDLQTQSQTTKI